MSDLTKLVAYVDVDDTLVRSIGAKQIPIPNVVAHVRELHAAGVTLYCWSSGGAEYARSVARRLDLEDCFAHFLPKPHILLDDQAPSEWRRLRVVRPLDVSGGHLDDYLEIL